ncbi:MAG: alpha/beta hydrolase [Gammaproteobacteria bacterium]|nr:alpha/beta hydrolase [Gammaproteobacteria bacterium]
MQITDVGPFARPGSFARKWILPVLLLCAAVQGLPAYAAGDDLVGPSTIDGLVATLGEVNGLRVRYYEAGRGEPLILLHGGRLTVFNSANMWAKNVNGLARDFHVFALDRYGYGMTGAYPDDDFTYEREVEFLLAFIDSINLPKVHIAGNSSGAAVALLFALAHPHRVSTLTLVAVGPHTPSLRSKGDIMREACDNIADPQLSWSCWMRAMTFRSETAFGPDFFAASEYMKSQPEWQEIEARKIKGKPQSDNEYWGPYLERVRNEGAPDLPILLVCGLHDNLDWPAGAEEPVMQGCMNLFGTLGNRNEKVKFIGYNQAGHFPYREQADQFNHDLAQFARFWRSEKAAGN